MTRAIEGQGTMLGRTMHAIDYDPIHDEIVVPQQFGQAILTFAGGANGEQAPLRIIQGSKTGLIAPDRLAVDPVNDEIYVPEGDHILVYPREANGNVAPVRVLRGPDTQLGASAVTVDTKRDLLIVAGSQGGWGSRQGHLLIFDRTASGNTKPKAVIMGPSTGLTSNRNLRVTDNGWILVTNDGRQRSEGDVYEGDIMSYVLVFSVYDSGDVKPRWSIGGPNGVLQKPRGVDLDPENKTVIVSDKYLNAVLTYAIPEVFDTPAEPASEE